MPICTGKYCTPSLPLLFSLYFAYFSDTSPLLSILRFEQCSCSCWHIVYGECFVCVAYTCNLQLKYFLCQHLQVTCINKISKTASKACDPERTDRRGSGGNTPVYDIFYTCTHWEISYFLPPSFTSLSLVYSHQTPFALLSFFRFQQWSCSGWFIVVGEYSGSLSRQQSLMQSTTGVFPNCHLSLSLCKSLMEKQVKHVTQGD